MHDIEPYYHWRERYNSERDEQSPFYGRAYSEFTFTNKVYNYFVHPQWDDFGSQTLYAKHIWSDYEEGFAVIELIGEWNDTLYNDVKFLKEEVIDTLALAGIHKYAIVCENVLNFHGDDNCYYEEWAEEARDEGGWVAFINTLKHVEEEMQETQLDHYVFFGGRFNGLEWRPKKPQYLMQAVEAMIFATPMRLG